MEAKNFISVESQDCVVNIERNARLEHLLYTHTIYTVITPLIVLTARHVES